ncbi:penicillin-binding protein 2 [Leadbettera azotonutricia]|uniref:Penicillin-binding protein 2 n=1 Tax=Leadbettera azotonutricia (strain ATCC BAA-888 / DSM 13862 / ZAS-9) TaxID=545695 RepID=F5YC80_LEAAZ|nr:penicillin-binding protein 2 [Leadbettera azotonutricia]AEF80335.1 penicillin-binding protein 2 [Leadbettera azotonutricia ZAS-9]
MASEREERPELRIAVLRGLFIFIFVAYAIRLFSMQILSGDVYRSRAQNIARRTTVIPAQRGEIYDRNYTQPLVLNTDSFAVSVTPAEVPRAEMDDLIGRLAAILNVGREQIERKLPPSIYYLYQPVEVAANVAFGTIAALAEQVDTLPGVSWQSKPMRSYVEIGSLSHIIGYVGGITRDELTMLYNKGYKQDDVIGKNGIERQYDEILRGREGRETRTVDVRGRRVGDNTRIAPTMGKNLVLTIDRKIQTLAEKALGRRIGAVVVTRPSTGEILAMVSYPWYDPNIFNHSDLGSEYQALISDPNKPLINRAIQSSYPPASTFKIIMTTGIIAENAFPPDQTIDCLGELSYGDRLWRCHIRRPGHGRLNLHQAMAQSCDIYYWNVGRDYLGVENIVNYARDYGYGDVTGIDIPGEISGFVPTPQWKDRRLHERWQGGDTMNMSIGQGYTLVTPLQMNNMVSMAANGGVVYKPHLLKEVRDPRTGAVEQSMQPEVLHQSDLPLSVFEEVRKDMRGVISEGTARFPLDIKAVEIAGKTGTAEVGLQDKWHSWFTSYAPYQTDDPEERVAVTVIVEAVNAWEWWAVYCSAIIYQGIFADQTYEEASRTLGIQNNLTIQGRRE